MSNNGSALRKSLSVVGKLFLGTRKGTSGERARLLRSCQKTIGVRFTDLSLLEQALTHRSYSHVTSQTRNDSNERMEFLGDSVLGLSVSQFLYLRFPERSEGALSKMKSLLVSRKVLSSVARECGLGEYILLSGEESEMGGRDRASILADSFEGVIGAIYLDQGYRAANAFITRFLLANITDILDDEKHTNYKSLLQEYVQSKRLSHPVYRVRREEGPEHEKEFAIDVVVKGQVWGTGRGKSKKDAEQAAARAALEERQQSDAPRKRSRRGADSDVSDEPANGRRASSGPREGRARRGADTPRAGRSRGRARPDEAGESTEARLRGGHGIAASRESLRRSREEEARPDRSRSSDRTPSDRASSRRAPSGESPAAGETRERTRSRRRRGRGSREGTDEARPRGGGQTGADDRTGAEAPAGGEPAVSAPPRREERPRRPAFVSGGGVPDDPSRGSAEPAEPLTVADEAPAGDVDRERPAVSEPRSAEPPTPERPVAEPDAGSAEPAGFVRRRRRTERPRPATDAGTAPPVHRIGPVTDAPVDVAESAAEEPSTPEPSSPEASSSEASSGEASSGQAPESPSSSNGTSSFARRKRRSSRGLRRR